MRRTAPDPPRGATPLLAELVRPVVRLEPAGEGTLAPTQVIRSVASVCGARGAGTEVLALDEAGERFSDAARLLAAPDFEALHRGHGSLVPSAKASIMSGRRIPVGFRRGTAIDGASRASDQLSCSLASLEPTCKSRW